MIRAPIGRTGARAAFSGAVAVALMPSGLGAAAVHRAELAGTARPSITAARCAAAPGGGLTLANVSAMGSHLVAVGSDGLIATSSEPARWTVRPTATGHALRGVVWTGSRWVVVGDAGTILTSSVAQVWRTAAGIPSSGLRAIAVRAGLVITAGSGGTLLSSTDGLTWNAQHSGTMDNLWGATRLGSTLLVSGQNSTVLASADGSSWTAVPTRPRPTDDQAALRPFLWQLAADGPRLVAVGDFGSMLEGSSSGLSAVTSPTDEVLRGVAFGRRVGAAVGSSGVILSSVAGGRWTAVSSPTTVDLRGVTYTGSQFVAVGDESTIISSLDGRHWRTDTTAMPCALLAVVHSASRYVAVGGSGRILSSPDGRNWRRLPRPTREDLYALADGPHGFIAAGARGTVLQSADGASWVRRRVATDLNLHAITWTGQEYLVGGDRGRLFASVTGARWRRVAFDGFHSIRDFATWGTTAVAAGAGTIARGADRKWTLEPIGFGRFQTSVAAGAGRFVIVGHNGEALVSTDDGRTWRAGSTGLQINLDRVVYADRRFVATGEGQALTSRDGLSWKPLGLPTRRSLRSIAVTGSRLIGVGDGGMILRSVNGGRRWTVVRTSAGN